MNKLSFGETRSHKCTLLPTVYDIEYRWNFSLFYKNILFVVIFARQRVNPICQPDIKRNILEIIIAHIHNPYRDDTARN